jgi:sigma-B regulation protein RsbU (phosphoserine phosphatase)
MKESIIHLSLIEDSLSDACLLQAFLAEHPTIAFRINTYQTLASALEEIPKSPTEIILTDLTLPDSSGIDSFRTLNARFSHLPIVVLTGMADEDLGLQTVKEGAQDYCIKSDLTPRLIAKTISYAIERKNTERQLRALNDDLKRINGEKQQAEKELKERIRAEQKLAGQIQQALLLGQPPEEAGNARIAYFTNPSEMVDGDFYDFFSHQEGLFDVVIADVMGKGIPAALIAAATKASFLRSHNKLLFENSSSCPNICDILRSVNQDLAGQLEQLTSFITMVYARFDLARQTLTQINCGHPSVLHFRAEDKQLYPEPEDRNPPLGLAQSPDFRSVVTPFSPGDFFFFYTDGIIDSRDAKGQFFGTQGLSHVIEQNYMLSPRSLIEEVRSQVRRFSGRDSLADDFTAVVVKIRATSAQQYAHQAAS